MGRIALSDSYTEEIESNEVAIYPRIALKNESESFIIFYFPAFLPNLRLMRPLSYIVGYGNRKLVSRQCKVS